MPSAKEWADSIAKMGKGSKAGMEKCGLVGYGCSREEFCMAFSSLDQALEGELHGLQHHYAGTYFMQD